MHLRNQMHTFQYLGGKYSMLPHLLPIVNVPCHHRVDVCGGSGVVLLNCDRAPIETYNDINGEVVNFFKVLRDWPEELIYRLELTPYARKEYDDAWPHESDSMIEAARKFFVRTQQSLYAAGAQAQSKGWAVSTSQSRHGISQRVQQWMNSVNNLYKVAERLKSVQIENRDFRAIFSIYDSEDTFFFMDGPYEGSKRSSTQYAFEFVNQDFLDMQYYAKSLKGKLALTGYCSEFMDELMKDFTKHILKQRNNTRSDKEAVECVWTNY